MEEMVKEKEKIVTEADLAAAMNGAFLDKIKECAWRGKEAKLPEVPSEEMHSFQVWVGFNFAADVNDKDPLTFEKLGTYRFTCSPITKEDVQKSLEEKEQESSDHVGE